MSETIVIALISFVGTAFGSILGVLTANKLTNYRIEQLEKKVEKHNNVVERVFRLEEKDAVHDEQLKVANHRISDLERVKQTT